MSDGKGKRGLLILGGVAVVALVAGLFVLMSANDPAPDPTRPDPVGVAEPDRPSTIGPSTAAAPDSGAVKPPVPVSSAPPVIHDHSGKDEPDAGTAFPVAPQIKNSIFRNVTPALTQCSPPPAGSGDQPRDFVVVGFTIVVDQGKVSLEGVDVSEAPNLTPEHRECLKKAFSAVAFELTAEQEPGRFPVTLQFAVP
jgi:hypothetical protein